MNEARRRIQRWLDTCEPVSRSELAALTGLAADDLTEFSLRVVLDHCDAKYGSGPPGSKRICGLAASPQELVKMRKPRGPYTSKVTR